MRHMLNSEQQCNTFINTELKHSKVHFWHCHAVKMITCCDIIFSFCTCEISFFPQNSKRTQTNNYVVYLVYFFIQLVHDDFVNIDI